MTASGAQWTIQGANQTAVVVEVGGGLRGYRVGAAEILDGYAESEIAPGAAGQILAPWPNRLRDGVFRFDGVAHQLPLTEPSLHNAIHGLVRWESWKAIEQTDDSVTVEHVLHPQPGYPWRLRLRARYAVDESGLRVEQTAVNLSDRAAPFGLGTHPYVFIPETPLADLSLRLRARTRLLVDGRLLPIGAARVAGGDFDYATPRKIGSTDLNIAFGNLDRDDLGRSNATVSAPDGRSVTVWADSTFAWWQLYTADAFTDERRRRSIALEPMTCPPDALRSGRDLIILEPGANWSATWGITATMESSGGVA